jgi:hypothetical protein
MANYWMIKWNPDAKSSQGFEQDWSRYLRSKPPHSPVRILKNLCPEVEVLTSTYFAEVKRCDVVFAYQARKGKLHGFCIVTGTEVRDGNRWVGLLPAYTLPSPICLLRMKEADSTLQGLECLEPSLPRTLYKLSEHDAALLFGFCPNEAHLQVATLAKACMAGKS